MPRRPSLQVLRATDREAYDARQEELAEEEDFGRLSSFHEGGLEGMSAASKGDYVAKCPGTQAEHDLWVRRFNQFLVGDLKANEDFVPTGETILTFISGVAHMLRGKCGPDKLPSAITLCNAAEVIKKHCAFKYNAVFRWKKFHGLRLSSLIEKLIQDKVITREEVRQHLWITSHLIKRMNEAIIGSALKDGTPSWEVTIHSILALTLQTALCARAGDISRTDGYTGLEALCWKDVTVFVPEPTGDPLPEGFSTAPLHARFILRYRKDEKFNSKKDFTVPIEELIGSSENAICLVKLLLIYALRTGAVAQKSWKDLLNSCNTYDCKIQWTRPELPVLCSVGHGRTSLDLDQPATVKDIQKALNLGSNLVGLLQYPTTHDLRRGAALEIDIVGPETYGGGNGTPYVQNGLGHDDRTRMKGVTKDYIGNGAPHNMWTARRRAREPENARITIDIAPEGAYIGPPRATPDDITGICEEIGLNPGSTADRQAAHEFRKKRHRDAWVQRQRELMQAPIPIDNTNLTVAGSQDRPNRFSTPVLDDDVRMRVRVLRDDFVQFFASHNPRKIHRNRIEGRWENGIYGGSADPPVVDKRINKVIPCTYADAGCKATFPSNTMLNRHLQSGCKFSDPSLFQYECDHEGCGKLFDTLDGLSAHKTRNHVVAQLKCTTQGCTSTEVFSTDAELRKHRYDVHRARAEYDGCPIPGCPNRRYFESVWAIKRHFKKEHEDLPREAKLRYIPVKEEFLNLHPEVRFFRVQRCSFPGCDHDVYFKHFGQYRGHASEKHNLWTKEAVAVFVLENPPPPPRPGNSEDDG